MSDRPEHLTPTQTDRGFAHFPPIPTWSGYEFPSHDFGPDDGRPARDRFMEHFPDFDKAEPHQTGEVRVYESSDAIIPSIWLNVVAEDDSGGTHDHRATAVHITVENARKLGEQLIALADNHYQGGGS